MSSTTPNPEPDGAQEATGAEPAQAGSGTSTRTQELSDRAKEASQKARDTWSRLRSRVTAQATQGAELAKLKREQLTVSREVNRRLSEIGRLASRSFADHGGPIAVEGALERELEALAKAEAEAARIQSELTDGAARLRKG